MPSLQELIQTMSETRQKRTIIEYLSNYLENEFGARDEGEPPQTMSVEETGELVSQPAIQGVLDQLDKFIAELAEEEVKLGNAEVALPKSKKKAPPKPKKKKAKQKPEEENDAQVEG